MYNRIPTPANLREVSQSEFHAKVGALNVDPIPQGGEDAASIWKLKTGAVVGKTCYTLNQHGRTLYPTKMRYFMVI